MHRTHKGEKILEEFKLYINTLKEMVDKHYDKEMIFYDDLGWYSREHGRNITPQELCDWVLELNKEEDYGDFSDTLPCGCCACCGCTCNDELG